MTPQKPAKPVTDAGKALLAESGPQEIGEPPSKWYCLSVDELPANILAIEAQAEARVLSDVEGLARALHGDKPTVKRPFDEGCYHVLLNNNDTYRRCATQAEAILAAWRAEK